MDPNLEEQLKNWIIYDNQLKLLNEKIHAIRDKKAKLTESILSTRNLSDSSINISDGKLLFKNTKIIAPLTFKYLEKTLGEIIKNDIQLKQIIGQIKSKREISIIPEIKRIYNV
jgi:hypothetical protein